jgi:hypothetical protein
VAGSSALAGANDDGPARTREAKKSKSDTHGGWRKTNADTQRRGPEETVCDADTDFAVGHAFIMYVANPSKDQEFGQTIGFWKNAILLTKKAANNRRRAPGSPSGRSGEAKKWGFDTQKC